MEEIGTKNEAVEEHKVNFLSKIKLHKFLPAGRQGKILAGILGILVFAGAAFGAYKLGQRQIQPSKPTPTPLPSEAPAKEGDPTANWKTYTNTKYGYSIKFPPHWQVEEDVNYVSPNEPDYTFFFKEKVEFMPGVSLYVVSSTTPGKWLGIETLKQGNKEEVLVDGIQGTRIRNIPGVEDQEWVFLNRANQTFIFYASGEKEELVVFSLMLSTLKFLEKKESAGEKVFCEDPRPEVCTMECIARPPYICGSDGKSYCSVCQACSNPKVGWYVFQEVDCESK